MNPAQDGGRRQEPVNDSRVAPMYRLSEFLMGNWSPAVREAAGPVCTGTSVQR